MIRSRRERREVSDGQDRGRGQLPAGAAASGGSLAARVRDQPVGLADQLLQVGEEPLLGRAGAVDADVRGALQLAHPSLPPHPRALGPRSEEGEERDAAGAVMRVQVGQLPPATDVRCLIQHPDQRHRQPPARGALRELLGGVAQRHRQSGHQPGGAALPLLAVYSVSPTARTRRLFPANHASPVVARVGGISRAAAALRCPNGVPRAPLLLRPRAGLRRGKPRCNSPPSASGAASRRSSSLADASLTGDLVPMSDGGSRPCYLTAPWLRHE
jgi:hypothetical protein